MQPRLPLLRRRCRGVLCRCPGHARQGRQRGNKAMFDDPNFSSFESAECTLRARPGLQRSTFGRLLPIS
jgi:hypothetical protein